MMLPRMVVFIAKVSTEKTKIKATKATSGKDATDVRKQFF